MKSKVFRGKLLVWLLAGMMMVATMTGCGGKEEDEDKDSKSKTEQSVDDEDEDEDVKDEETASEKEENTEVVETKEDEESEEKEVEAVSKEETVVKEDEEDKEITEEEANSEAYDVVVKMVDACQGKMMTRSTMDMVLELSIGVEGFFIDMDMNMTGETLASADPFISYSDLVLNMNAMGENMVETTKSYTVVEDGKMIIYSYAGSEDQWYKEDMGIDAATMLEQQNGSYEFLLGKAEEDYVLDSALHNINGRDAYKLSFTLTGAELQNTMNGTAGMEDLMAEAGMEGLDMSALVVPTVYYVDAETYQIVGMEMSIEGMSEVLGSVMDELMAAESAEYSMSFEIGECKMIYSNISYDPVEIPELPEEVIALQDLNISVETDL